MSKAQALDPFAAGVIEGFFGTAWSWAARSACVEYLPRAGYGFYIYAPKSDPFLRRQWRDPIPAALESSLSMLSRECRARNVAFGVGLSPFEIYRDYGADAQRALRVKVQQLNRVGVDMLCILFDDMRGDIPSLAELQANIVADIASWTTAPKLIFCPTYYSFDPILERVFGPAPARYLEDLSRRIDAAVDFFWTGERVCATRYDAQHLVEVASILGRKPFIWDNNVTNDSKLRSKFLFLTPDAGEWELPAGYSAGLAVNPMNQPYLSQLALCAYARMLGLAAAGDKPLTDCFALCGTQVRPQLREDLDYFQRAGQDGIDAALRRAMVERYESFLPNPYAADLLAWLRGEYTFDPACLTA